MPGTDKCTEAGCGSSAAHVVTERRTGVRRL